MSLSLVHQKRLLLVICSLLGGLSFLSDAASLVPPAAKPIIQQVHLAAKKKDTMALQKLMVDDFVWSFGGDGSAQQALDAWKARPAAFKHLYRVTGATCGVIARDIVECPRNAGPNYRAGFREMQAGWRMVYFVAGD